MLSSAKPFRLTAIRRYPERKQHTIYSHTDTDTDILSSYIERRTLHLSTAIMTCLQLSFCQSDSSLSRPSLLPSNCSTHKRFAHWPRPPGASVNLLCPDPTPNMTVRHQCHLISFHFPPIAILTSASRILPCSSNRDAFRFPATQPTLHILAHLPSSSSRRRARIRTEEQRNRRRALERRQNEMKQPHPLPASTSLTLERPTQPTRPSRSERARSPQLSPYACAASWLCPSHNASIVGS